MIGEKLSIRVQILVLLLASGILSFLALGGVLLGSMYGMKESAIVSGREMEESAGNFIEEFVRNQVYRELTLVAREKALQVENKMSLVAADTEYIARAMNKILAHPESCKPWKLPTPAEKRLRGGEAYLLFSEKASGGAIAPALRREIDIAANIADDLEVITKLYLGYDANCYIGSKHGYCIATEGKLSDENYHQVFDAADFAAYDPRERIWYRAAKEAQKAVFTDVYRGRDDSMEITCAAPYYDADGFAGAAGIDLRLDALYRLIADKSFWHSYTYFAINADGDILFSSETEGEISVSAENRNLKTSAEPDFAAAIARMAQGETGAEPVTVGGEKHYLAYAPIPRLGWSFGALTKSDIAAHPVENAGRAVAGISADFAAAVADIFDGRLKEAAVLLLLILAAIVYLSRRTADWFVRPLLGLTDGVRAIAKGDLDRKLYIKTGDEIETLSDSVNTMTEELKAYMENLAAATAEKERVSTELRLAAAIQSGMLPAVSPEFSGRDEYELHAFMDAARKVGGDFYDFYALDEDTLALTIADVSGKGIPASLFMVVAKTVLKNVALSGGWARTLARSWSGRTRSFARTTRK